MTIIAHTKRRSIENRKSDRLKANSIEQIGFDSFVWVKKTFKLANQNGGVEWTAKTVVTTQTPFISINVNFLFLSYFLCIPLFKV